MALMAENVAALFVFAFGAAGIALGYAMHNFIDGARDGWEAYARRRSDRLHADSRRWIDEH